MLSLEDLSATIDKFWSAFVPPPLKKFDPVAYKLARRKHFIREVIESRCSQANFEIRIKADNLFRLALGESPLPHGSFGQPMDPDTMFAHLAVRGAKQCEAGTETYPLMTDQQAQWGVNDWTFRHEWLIQCFVLATRDEARTFCDKYGHLVDWADLKSDLDIALKLEDSPSIREWADMAFADD